MIKTEAVGLSDEVFLRQFETCTLPYVHWTHRAHLRVAYLYVTRFGLAGAIPKVTSGIRAYNKSQNIVDTPTSGYHETMTLAWLHLVAAMVAEYGPTGAVAPGSPSLLGPDAPASLEFLEAQTQLHEKKLLRLFYTRERFCSPEAKYNFVAPDLAPLPGKGHLKYMHEYKATIHWKNQGPDFLKGRYSREHTWTFDGGLTVAASSSPAVVPVPWSNAANIDPEEAFVASLSSCHMLTFIWLAGKAGFLVESYRDDAVGVMAKNERGAFWVSKVTLHPQIAWGGDKAPTTEELDKLHHRSHEECFIANSVKTEVTVGAAQA